MDGKFLILIFVGLFLVDSTDCISGGEVQNNPDIQLFAAIYNSRHDYICTGTIISSTAIVTSASCLGYYADFKEGEINDKHRMALFARILNKDRRVRRKNSYHIKQLVKHEKWDYEKPDHDCAILKPTNNIQGDYVMALPRDDDDLSTAGKDVIILGWGASRENFPNEYLMQRGDPQIISMDECKEKYPDENLDDVRFFCTHKRGSGACSGDDGGPVLVWAPQIRKADVLTLIGIIGYRKGCGYPEYPDIHVNIKSVLEFIKREGGEIQQPGN